MIAVLCGRDADIERDPWTYCQDSKPNEWQLSAGRGYICTGSAHVAGVEIMCACPCHRRSGEANAVLLFDGRTPAFLRPGAPPLGGTVTA